MSSSSRDASPSAAGPSEHGTSAARIVILDGYTVNPGDNTWEPLARLGALTVYDRTPPNLIVERCLEAEVVLTNKVPLTADTIGRLPALRFISVLATGYNVVDIEAARSHGIPVSNVPEYATESVAQHVFALLLELCNRVAEHASAVASGEWNRAPDFSFWRQPPLELAGRTIGVIGFGRIGRKVGKLAHAFGMAVLAAGGSRRSDPGYRPFRWRSIGDVFAEAHVITLHCPLTRDNEGFVNRELLSRVRPGAILINTARGGLVNEHDLARSLREGRLAAAALDVVGTEPMQPDNPLLGMPNCIITPHMAWASLAARRRLVEVSARNVAAFLAGSPINVVN